MSETRLEKLIEKYRQQLEDQIDSVYSNIHQLDKADPKTIILQVEELIKLCRKFLKKYEAQFPLPEEPYLSE